MYYKIGTSYEKQDILPSINGHWSSNPTNIDEPGEVEYILTLGSKFILLSIIAGVMTGINTLISGIRILIRNKVCNIFANKINLLIILNECSKTVRMLKDEYTSEMCLLNDNKTYSKLVKDPTNSIQT